MDRLSINTVTKIMLMPMLVLGLAVYGSGGGGETEPASNPTLTVDTTPNAFSFVDQDNVALNSLISSSAITIAGINSGAVVSITGGEYAIDGGEFVSGAGSVNNG